MADKMTEKLRNDISTLTQRCGTLEETANKLSEQQAEDAHVHNLFSAEQLKHKWAIIALVLLQAIEIVTVVGYFILEKSV